MSDNHTEQSDHSPSRSFSWFTAVWIGSIVVALYVFSVGPVARMYRNDGDVPKTIQAFYAPLEFLHENVPMAERAISWYLDLWGV